MYIVPFIVSLLLCTIYYFALQLDTNVESKNINETLLNLANDNLEFGVDKKDCTSTKVYCTSSAECETKCLANTSKLFKCNEGVCKVGEFETTQYTGVECDASKGMMMFLVGDTAMGRYERICKSIDPGIAISNDENLMCKGDESFQVNYIKKYPEMSDCKCKNSIIIPATRAKRRHLECENILYDMVV